MFREEKISGFCGLQAFQNRFDGQEKWTRKIDRKKMNSARFEALHRARSKHQLPNYGRHPYPTIRARTTYIDNSRRKKHHRLFRLLLLSMTTI
jgi:hypothetical protein